MTFSGHIAVTGLTLVVIHDPLALIAINLLLHLVVDMVPHAEYQPLKSLTPLPAFFMGLDLALTLALIQTIFQHIQEPTWVIIVAILAGLFLDLSDAYARRHWKKLRFIHEFTHTLPLLPSDAINWGKTLTGRTPTWSKISIQALLIVISYSIITQA